MRKRSNGTSPVWVVGGIALIVLLILGANSHMLYVAVSSQPGCLEETIKAGAGGAVQVLRAAQKGC